MVDFNEIFGIPTIDPDEQNVADMAAGYQQGCVNATAVHEAVRVAWAGKSRAFREGLLDALREHI